MIRNFDLLKKVLINLCPYVFSFAILYFLINFDSLNVSLFSNQLKITPYNIFLFSLCMISCASFFMVVSEKFKLFLNSIYGIQISSFESFRINLNSFFIATVSSFALSADIYRFKVLGDLNLNKKQSINFLLIERFYTLFYLIIVGFIFTFFIDRKILLSFDEFNISYSLFFFVILIIFFLRIFKSLFFLILEKIKKINFIRFNLLILFFIVTYSIILYTVIIFLNLSIPFEIVLLATPILLIAQNLPLFIAGFGPRELCFIFFFSDYASNDSLLMCSILAGVALVIFSFISLLDFKNIFYFR